MRQIKVGLLGLGTVGSGVVRLVNRNKEDLWKRTGFHIDIKKVLVRDINKERTVEVPSNRLTDHPMEVIHDPEIDVIIEVMGGIHPAKQYVQEAILNKKHVVTANKDLMAEHGAELLKLAKDHNCDLFYEASVAGGIPIINAMIDGFSSDRVRKIMGIVNGTTNYILSKMSLEKESYHNALKEAQALGYAEENPASDVEGFDAARKMVILSTLGFHQAVQLKDVSSRGITEVTVEDIEYGKRLGYTIKLLGIAKEDDGQIEVSVEPTMIKNSHPLAMVQGVNNAVYVYGEAVGETMFYGPGAGELPTATAVVSDLVSVAKNIKLGVSGKVSLAPYKPKRNKEEQDIFAKYFIRIVVMDQSGVLAKIASLLATQDMSIEQIIQEPYKYKQGLAELIIITHHTSVDRLNNVLQELSSSEFVEEIKSYYRVEGE